MAYNYGTLDTRSIAIDVEGDIHASGTGAQGVRVGALNTDTTDTVPDGTPTYSAELSARQELHSGGEDYSGVIHVGMRF